MSQHGNDHVVLLVSVGDSSCFCFNFDDRKIVDVHLREVKFGCAVIWKKREKGNSIDQQTDSKPVPPRLRGPFYALLERSRARRVERSHWRKGALWCGFYIRVPVQETRGPKHLL